MSRLKYLTGKAGKTILNSYSQVFFSTNKILGLVLLLVSFFDLWLGLSAVVSVLVANIVAYLLGYDRSSIVKGLYGFNSLLTGLAIATFFAPSWKALLLVVLVAILTLFISIVLQGVLAKYGLPYLSLPFLFAVWMVLLGLSDFSSLGISLRGIYTHNELYSLGGIRLVNIYDFITNLQLPAGLKTYFLSLSAIFFQYNVLVGVAIALGLLLYSRHLFLMSLIGFYVAYWFYQFIGVPVEELNYTYFGFNYILTAIALGGFFIIPSWRSLAWLLVIIPTLVVITIGVGKLFALFSLPVYSLPFNLAVLGFVYALRLRVYPDNKLKLAYIQHRNPEQNAYFDRAHSVHGNLVNIKFSLPFFGQWTVSQGFDGKYTHKDAWRYAWDFVIVDAKGNQFRDKGLELTDYYCYDKPVVAPADGVIVDIVDGIEDNVVGDVNLAQNWGNTIVIQHAPGIYSQLSHLRKGTIKVIKGQYVKRGQILAHVGNSGRSPYPHLHFQLQTSPIIGSKTMEGGFSDYLDVTGQPRYVKYGQPQEGSKVSNIETIPLLKQIFSFIPGKRYTAEVIDEHKHRTCSFVADTDIYNNQFLMSESENEKIYLVNNGVVLKMLNYIGRRRSPLFILYQTLNFIPLGYYENVQFYDFIPLHFTNNKLLVWLQDFLVSFVIFLKTRYVLEFEQVNDVFNPTEIKMRVRIENYFFKKKLNSWSYQIIVSRNECHIKSLDKSKFEMIWKEESYF